jgi:hypothetical protein
MQEHFEEGNDFAMFGIHFGALQSRFDCFHDRQNLRNSVFLICLKSFPLWHFEDSQKRTSQIAKRKFALRLSSELSFCFGRMFSFSL